MSFKNTDRLKGVLRCPACGGRIEWLNNKVRCENCNTEIKIHNKALVFYSKSLLPNYNKPSYSSSNGYHWPVIELIKKHKNGLILDYGAGNQIYNYPNVVQLDVSLYPNTDVVIGTDSPLPFKDSSIDGVISLAVLEHVKDPFFYISEIYRVLKPNRSCILDTAFLQPLHASPAHYFNTTSHAVELLFKDFETDVLRAGPHQQPWIMLKWILQSYINGMKSEKDREAFRKQTIGELEENFNKILEVGKKMQEDSKSYEKFLEKTWNYTANLPEAIQCLFNITENAEKELAAGFHVIARKPSRKNFLTKILKE